MMGRLGARKTAEKTEPVQSRANKMSRIISNRSEATISLNLVQMWKHRLSTDALLRHK